MVYPYEIEDAAAYEIGTELSITHDANLLGQIQSAPTLEAAIDNLKKLTVARSALKTADMFRKQSVKYAMMESAALIRVIELGGEKNITPYRRRKAAQWLYSLNDEERNEMIQRCRDGVTIEHVYQQEVDNPKKEARAIVTAKAYEDAVIDTFASTGIVTLNSFDEKLNSLPIDKDIVQGTKDRVRDKLRRMGGVGIGDGAGTYVSEDNPTKLSEAIETRIASMQADFIRLAELCKKCDTKPTFRINTHHNHTNEMPICNYFYIMLAAAGVASVETTTSKKESIIISKIIDNTFPDYWQSYALLDDIAHRYMMYGNRFSDVYGIPAQAFRNIADSIEQQAMHQQYA